MQLQFQRLLRFQVELLPDPNFQSESASSPAQLSCLFLDSQAPHLYIGDTSGNLHCFDIDNGKKLSVLQWHQHPIVAISRHQNCLYSFDRLQNLVAWDLSASEVIKTYHLAQIEELSDLSYKYDLHESFEKHYGAESIGYSTSKTSRFTDDGRHLFFGVNCSHAVNPNIHEIDVTTGSLVRVFNWEEFYRSKDDDFYTGEIDAIAISKDGKQLAASGYITFWAIYYDGGFSYPDWTHSSELIHQWSIEDGIEVCCYEYDDYCAGAFDPGRIDLAFSPLTHQLLVKEKLSPGLSLWNVPQAGGDSLIAKGEATPTETLRDRLNLEYDNDNTQWRAAEQGVCDWSPIGSLVAFGSLDGKLKFVNISTGDILFEQQVSDVEIQQVKFSSDGKLLALYSQDLTCEVWQIV